MFDPTSRYINLENSSMIITDAAGATRVLVYKRRRLIPSADRLTTLVEHTVLEGERLDNITARYVGDPTLFWRVCDANVVLQPAELEVVGCIVRIALPQVGG